jgi:hypothetical protein
MGRDNNLRPQFLELTPLSADNFANAPLPIFDQSHHRPWLPDVCSASRCLAQQQSIQAIPPQSPAPSTAHPVAIPGARHVRGYCVIPCEQTYLPHFRPGMFNE